MIWISLIILSAFSSMLWIIIRQAKANTELLDRNLELIEEREALIRAVSSERNVRAKYDKIRKESNGVFNASTLNKLR